MTASRLYPLLLLLACGCGRDPAKRLALTYPVVRGDLVVAVEARGIIEPLSEVEISSRTSGKIARIVEDGTQVEPGDLVAELESERLRYRLVDRKADLRSAQAELKRQTAYADMRIDGARYSLELAEASAEVARAEYENAKAGVLTPEEDKITAAANVKATEISKKDESRKLGVLSELERMGVQDEIGVERQEVLKRLADLDAEKAAVMYEDVMAGLTEEELRQAELELRLAEHRVRAAKKRLDEAEKRKKHTVSSYERRMQRRERYLKDTQEQLDATSIKAKAPGVVMIKSMWGRKLVSGRYVYRTQPIASLPDLSRLKVSLWLDEDKAAGIKPGQRAEIVVPPHPKRRLSGKVKEVSRLVKEAMQDLSDRERKRLPPGAARLIKVSVAIEDTGLALKCGGAAEVRIIVREGKGHLHIPKCALRTRLRVLFAVDPDEAQYVRTGLLAEISSPSLPNVTSQGVIRKVGRLVAGDIQPMGSMSDLPSAAEIELEGADERLKPGTDIVVSIAMAQPARRHYLPKQGIKFERHHFVLVRGRDADEERRVETGPMSTYRVVIKSGLSKGEALVPEGV